MLTDSCSGIRNSALRRIEGKPKHSQPQNMVEADGG